MSNYQEKLMQILSEKNHLSKKEKETLDKLWDLYFDEKEVLKWQEKT